MAAPSYPGTGEILTEKEYKKSDIRNNITKLFKPGDYDVLNIIFKYKGAVFGGYLRDIISDNEPSDIDVAISEMYAPSFFDEIEDLGYDVRCIDDIFNFSKEGHREVEVILTEDDPDDTILGPAAYPDFDVNLLVYSRQDGLNDWTGEIDVNTIIDHILNKTAHQISSDEDLEPDTVKRKEKLTRKGFTLKLLPPV